MYGQPATALPDEQRLFGVTTAARVLDVGKSTIYEKIQTGEIRVVRIGARVLIPRAELERYIAQLCADAGIELERVGAGA